MAQTQKKLIGWLNKGWTLFVDPEREQRIAEATARLNRWLSEHRNGFVLSRAIEACNIEADDVTAISERVYADCIDRAWKDLELSEGEGKTLIWVASALHLAPATAKEIRLRKGHEIFSNLLARAIEDGHVDADEYRRLNSVCQWCETGVRDYVRQYFTETGASFLRGIFTAAIEDGALLQDEWQRYIESAGRLGFSQTEAAALVEPFAQDFVEHILADAKSDGMLSAQEERTLKWLLDQLSLGESFRSYVLQEVRDLRQVTEIAAGHLPSIEGFREVELRAGEIVHYDGAADYIQDRKRQSQIVSETHPGRIVITDYRTVFTSALKSFSLNHSAVLQISRDGRGVEVRTGSKGAGRYRFGDRWELPVLIWPIAIGRANQTVIAKSTGGSDRYIPRDVRQRVWQRYAGRCAECQADQYLEFDHIVPVALGGSNSDLNVQTLCRRCNLKKRDSI